MHEYICLDSSVVIKVLVPEEMSTKATELMQRILLKEQLIVLPSFAWAEIGSILRKKCLRKELKATEADTLWLEFTKFPGIVYLENDLIIDRSWNISKKFNLPTLYDAAFLAAAEIVSETTGSPCEFWTADEKLMSTVTTRKAYVKLLRNLQ
jgi:predicted nucleic acid-binding protein